MSTVITVMNMKGGVGKTTVTANIGGMLAAYEWKKRWHNVLLIDYDPQFNLAQMYIPSKTYFDLEEKRKTSLAILQDNETQLDPYTLQVPGNLTPPKVATLVHRFRTYGTAPKQTVLDIIPSTLDLTYVALGQPTARLEPIEERFAKFIEECRKTYDLVLIDCHPSGSLLTRTSLRNCDHVLVPVVPQQFAIRGVGLMLKFINATAGATAPKPHLLFNCVPSNGVAAEESSIRNDPRFGKYCLVNTLRWYKALQDPQGGDGFVWTSTRPWSDTAFRNLQNVVEEFVARI